MPQWQLISLSQCFHFENATENSKQVHISSWILQITANFLPWWQIISYLSTLRCSGLVNQFDKCWYSSSLTNTKVIYLEFYRNVADHVLKIQISTFGETTIWLLEPFAVKGNKWLSWMWSQEKARNQLLPDAQHKMQSLKVRANAAGPVYLSSLSSHLHPSVLTLLGWNELIFPAAVF